MFVAITGVACYALFILDLADARTGIEGAVVMMMVFSYASLSAIIEIRKRLTALEKEIKGLKNNK